MNVEGRRLRFSRRDDPLLKEYGYSSLILHPSSFSNPELFLEVQHHLHLGALAPADPRADRLVLDVGIHLERDEYRPRLTQDALDVDREGFEVVVSVGA